VIRSWRCQAIPWPKQCLYLKRYLQA